MIKTQKQLQSEQTRGQIIESAAHLFASKGFQGTSMSDLAAATGLTKGAFYHHFENKETLFHAVVESIVATWDREVGHEALKEEQALDQLSALLSHHARLLRTEPTLCLVMTGLSAELEGTNPGFAAVLHGVYAALISFIEGIIRRGQADQQVRMDVDARLVAVSIVGLLRGVSCFGVLGDMGLDSVIVIEATKPMLLDGLRSR